MKLSIIIPCYNEAQNIPCVLEAFVPVFAKLPSAELILVDNNSKDNTQQVLREHLGKYPFARAVLQRTPGYGAAVRKGLESARGEFLCWTHADMQTPPEDTARAYKLLSREQDPKRCYVKGERKGRPLADRFFTTGMSILETTYLATLLRDINAQPNVLHRSFYERLGNLPDDFSLDLYMLYAAKREGLKVIRFPVTFGRRLHGKSSWNTSWSSKWKLIRRTIAFSRSLRPMLKGSRGTLRYSRLAKELLEVPFLSFCFFGVLSTLLNYAVFYVLLEIVRVQYLFSAAAGYVAGVLFSFSFNRKITFKSSGRYHQELARYLALYATTLVFGLGALYVLVNILGLDPLFANIIAIIFTTLSNFTGSRIFVFRSSR